MQTSHFSPQNILIMGERGIGKTSIAYVVKAMAEKNLPLIHEAKNNLITAYLSVKKNTPSPVAISQIVEELETQLEPFRTLLGAASDSVKNFVKNFQSISVQGLEIKTREKKTIPIEEIYIEAKKTLRKCANACKNMERTEDSRSICIIVDELDRMADFENFSSFWKGLQETLGADDCNSLMLVFVGMPEIKDKLAADHESIIRSFTPIYLDRMERQDAEEVIKKALSKSGKTISNEAVEKILNYSESFPHLIQELGYSAFEVSESNEIMGKDVDLGIHGNESYLGSIARLGELFFSRMYDEIKKSGNFREILKIIAKLSSIKQKWVSRQAVLKEFSGKSTNLDSSIRVLKEKKLIITNPEIQGQYRIASKMFQAYIEKIFI